MKKTIVFWCIILTSLFTTSYALSTSSNNWYNSPIIDESLNFKAEVSWEKVYLSWNIFTKSEWFKYYKVIKSQDISNPVYPDNWYITAISNINETKYIDYKLLNWINYYRVCAIMSDMNRYCSNVVKLNIEKVNPTACTMDYSPVCGKLNWVEKTFSNKCMLNSSDATYLYTWECKKTENIKQPIACTMESKACPDWSYVGRTWPNCEFQACPTNQNTNITNKIKDYNLKLKADKIVNQFIEKVEKIYTNNEKRITILTTVVEKLNNLANNKPNQKDLINYIISKINSKIEQYKWDDLSDIESIFNEIQ